jgi:hypothetical protein
MIDLRYHIPASLYAAPACAEDYARLLIAIVVAVLVVICG